MLGWQFRLIKALAFIHKKHLLSQADFQNYYEDQHAPLAKSLLAFESYERNYIDPVIHCPIKDLGSISVFKYASEKSLGILAEQMSSTPGDTLRKDELNFMNVPLNFYIFTNSTDESSFEFKRKIFYVAREQNQLGRLDGIRGIEKISENLIENPQLMIGIPEYGVSEELSVEDLRMVTSNFPEVMLTNTSS